MGEGPGGGGGRDFSAATSATSMHRHCRESADHNNAVVVHVSIRVPTRGCENRIVSLKLSPHATYENSCHSFVCICPLAGWGGSYGAGFLVSRRNL